MEEKYIEQFQVIVDKLKSKPFKLIPPSSDEDVKKFEERFNVDLPEDYRWFITNIANGILSIEEWGFHILQKQDWANYIFWEDEYNPSIPFPLTKRSVGYSKDYAEDRDLKYPYETFYDDEADFFHDGYRFGEISLRGSGCGSDDFLVVKGEERGNVWIDNYSSMSEVYPCYNEKEGKQRLNFTEWLIFIANIYL